MVSNQILHIFRRSTCQIHANSAGDKDLLDPRGFSSILHQFHEWSVIGTEQLADCRMHAGLASAFGLDFRPAASHFVHVSSRSTDVADHAFELRILSHLFDFANHRFMTARLNNASLVSRNRTECATAEAASHDRDGVLDHVEGGNLLRIRWMRSTRVGHSVDRIHCWLRNRKPRRIANDCLTIMKLHQALRVVWIGFIVNDLGGFRESGLVCGNQLEGRQPQELGRLRRIAESLFGFLGTKDVRHASHITKIANGFARSQSASDLQNGVFTHSEPNQIGFRVQQDGAANFVAPVIVVSQTPQ